MRTVLHKQATSGYQHGNGTLVSGILIRLDLPDAPRGSPGARGTYCIALVAVAVHPPIIAFAGLNPNYVWGLHSSR